MHTSTYLRSVIEMELGTSIIATVGSQVPHDNRRSTPVYGIKRKKPQKT